MRPAGSRQGECRILKAIGTPARFSLAITFPRIPKLCCENRGGLLAQSGAVNLDRLPDFIPVDTEICVDQNISKGNDLRPRDEWRASCQFIGDPRRCLTDDRQFLHDGAANQFGFLKTLKIRFADERGDVVSSLNDVVEVQVVTPHRAIVRLQAPKPGCAA